MGKVIGENRELRMWHWTAIFGLMVLIIVTAALALWEFYVRPNVAPASVEKMAYPLPHKPSIAVLPFDNMSKDPDQEYFSDGIVDNGKISPGTGVGARKFDQPDSILDQWISLDIRSV